MSKVSKRETEQNEEARRIREGTAGMVQCDGCPAGAPLVQPGKPGHLERCTECSRHCACFRDSRSSGPDA